MLNKVYQIKITFWGEDKGGRVLPPMPGYRPHVAIGSTHTSCTINTNDNAITKFDFDIEYQVVLELMYSCQYDEVFESGDTIKLYEGNKQVAEGRVV